MFDNFTFEELYVLSTALTQMIDNAEDGPLGEPVDNPVAERLLDAVDMRIITLTNSEANHATGQ